MKDFFNGLNGWQRIFIFLFVIGLIPGIGALVSTARNYPDRFASEFFEGVISYIFTFAALYLMGWGIAWIRRGFKK